MKLRDKEYQFVDSDKVSLKGAKFLLLVTGAYDAYIGANEEEEPAVYERLKKLWGELSGHIIINHDEVIQNLDHLGVPQFKEVFTTFFPLSSEAKK